MYIYFCISNYAITVAKNNHHIFDFIHGFCRSGTVGMACLYEGWVSAGRPKWIKMSGNWSVVGGSLGEVRMESSGGFIPVTWSGKTQRLGLGRTVDWTTYPCPLHLARASLHNVGSEKKHPDSKRPQQGQ